MVTGIKDKVLDKIERQYNENPVDYGALEKVIMDALTEVEQKAREDSEQKYNQLKEDVGKSCPPCYELTLRNEKAQERIAELEEALHQVYVELDDERQELRGRLGIIILKVLKKKVSKDGN